MDGATAYKDAEFVIIAAPQITTAIKISLDTSAVEDVIELVLKSNPDATMVIKSTIPVGYTKSVREKYGTKNILFSPEFLRESRRCMTICIQAESSLVRMRMMKGY